MPHVEAAGVFAYVSFVEEVVLEVVDEWLPDVLKDEWALPVLVEESRQGPCRGTIVGRRAFMS